MGATGTNDHLLDYWAVLVRRRWVVYLAVATCALAALAGSFLATPLYRATCTLQIERQRPDILTFRDLAQVDSSYAAYNDFYQTQYKVIGSQAVARLAVERMALMSHPEFASEGRAPGLLARLRSLLPSRRSGVEVDPVDVAASRLLAALDVTPVRNSHLVQISFLSPDSPLAAAVANETADAYVQLTIDSRYSTSGHAEEFLVAQIVALKDEITSLEERRQRYGESKQIVSIDESSNITLQALQAIAGRRTDAQTALAKAQAALSAARSAPPDALPEVMNSALISRLRQEYAVYEADYTQKSMQFGAEWPGVRNLESKLEQARARLEIEIANIAGQVLAAAESSYTKALDEVENLDRLLADKERAAQRLKREAVEFANLQSEVQKKRETLNALIARQNEIALSTRLKDVDSSTNIRVMERARPPVIPFRPNTRMNLMLGLVLGLMIGVGAAFTLDYLDNTINSVEELRRAVTWPNLAVVPRHRPQQESGADGRAGRLAPAASFDWVSHLDSRTITSEAYRELRTSLLMFDAGQPPRRIMVTSAMPEEGKTATAINLAIVLAQLGRRVAVVDTDLRRPRLHKALGVEGRRGLSHYLAGLESDLDRLLLASPVRDLSILISGPVPPNPSELLNAPRFRDLGGLLLARGFDHVIFDSPPALSVADPVIIASAVDLGILVVRAGKTPRPSVRLAAEKLVAVGVPFGTVLNDVDTEAPGSSYRRYRYFERYGDPVAETEVAANEDRAENAGA